MFVNGQGEWESASEPEEDGLHEEALAHDKTTYADIQADDGDNNCFVFHRVLNVNVGKEENNQRHNIFHTCGTIKHIICRIIVDNGS